MISRSLACLLALVPAFARPQHDLTLQDALSFAAKNNGAIKSAIAQYESSRSLAVTAYSSYYPQLTPSFSYETSATDTLTGPTTGLFRDVNSASSLTASWLLFDDGAREAGFRRASHSREAAKDTALFTVRRTLFDVHRAFFDAIRAEQLLKVREQQYQRALEVESQAKAFSEAGAGAQKDVLQARADALNAKALAITAQNSVASSRATLKALIGAEFGGIAHSEQSAQYSGFETLAAAVQAGLENRPDLAASRYRINAQREFARLARINSLASWTLDVRHVKSFSSDPFDRSALVFQVSVPLFDGFRAKESARSQELTLESLKSDLTQSERDAVAEIEAAYNEDQLNVVRLDAARAAHEAAKLNYDAAFEARKEGAGDLISVLTAQVSLSTAESNLIEATFDTLISGVRLRLVTGQAIPGEVFP